MATGVDRNLLMVVMVSLFFVGVSAALAIYLLSERRRRWMALILSLGLLAPAGGLALFEPGAAGLMLLFLGSFGLPLLIADRAIAEQDAARERRIERKFLNDLRAAYGKPPVEDRDAD